jgi:hypothetical protein
MKKTIKLLTAAGVLACTTAAALVLLPPTELACAAAADTTSFAEDVFPIFKGRCVDCHAPGKEGFEKSGLDLTTYDGLMKGTKFGPMVKARDPDSSNLIWLLDWRGGNAHATRQEEALDLRSQRDPHLDSRGRQEQLIRLRFAADGKKSPGTRPGLQSQDRCRASSRDA